MKLRQMPLELKELFEALKSKDPISKKKQDEFINKTAKFSDTEMMLDICEEKGNTSPSVLILNRHCQTFWV